MSIDWFTVAVQLANFWLLMWLLRRFLYRPILNGIAAREAEIARRMAAADTARAEAREAQARYEATREQGLAQQTARVEQALLETREEREALLAQARSQMAQEQAEWKHQLDEERDKFRRRLHEEATTTLVALARKALHELADETLEAAIVRRLAGRLQPMASELRAAGGDHGAAQLATRAALDPALQAQLRTELAALLPGVVLNFRVDEHQSPGVVLEYGGARVEWTLDRYLEALAP